LHPRALGLRVQTFLLQSSGSMIGAHLLLCSRLPWNRSSRLNHTLTRARSDSALIRRYAAGDESAFVALYERYRSPVLAVCIGVLGTAHDAEDALQETFASLAVSLRESPPRELRPWLTRVARNAAIDVVRRRRRRGLTLDGEVPELPAQPPSTGADELAVVIEGIRELPPGQRTALLMRELGGHSYAEIATLLETDQEAVRGLIARARTGLRGYREATELPCATAQAAIAAEPDGRLGDGTVRRHVRGCAACRSYRAALRRDARALRSILPVPAGGVAGGGMLAGGLAAAKGALVGVGITQATAACAASICAVGGLVLLAPPVHPLGAPAQRRAASPQRRSPHRPTRTVTAPLHRSAPPARYAGVRASAQPLRAPGPRSSVTGRWATAARATPPRPAEPSPTGSPPSAPRGANRGLAPRGGNRGLAPPGGNRSLAPRVVGAWTPISA